MVFDRVTLIYSCDAYPNLWNAPHSRACLIGHAIALDHQLSQSDVKLPRIYALGIKTEVIRLSRIFEFISNGKSQRDVIILALSR